MVARSEFMTIEQGLCELLWLKIILEDSRIKWKGPSLFLIATTNQPHNPIQHDRTKHKFGWMIDHENGVSDFLINQLSLSPQNKYVPYYHYKPPE